MATYNNIKKLKIGDNVYNLYDSGGTVTGMTTTAGAHTAGAQTVSGGIITTNIPTKTSHLTNDSGYITSDSDEKVKVTQYSQSTTYYPILATGIGTATRQIATNGMSFSESGGGVKLDLGLDSNHWGVLSLGGESQYKTTISGLEITANRSLTLPDKSGTIALTSDIPTIPTIPTITLNGTATTSPSFYAPTTVGTSGYVLKSNGSGAPTWTSATLTDTKVTEAYSTSNSSYPILMTATAGISSTSSRGATTSILNNQIYANPSTGTISAAYFNGAAAATTAYTTANLKNIIESDSAPGSTTAPNGTVWLQYGTTWIDDAADYVVEHGTSGIWTYRKWNSGIAECWGRTAAATYSHTSTSGYGYYTTSSVSLPSELFTTVTCGFAERAQGTGSGSSNTLITVNVNTLTTTTLGFFVQSASTGSQSITISCRVIGTWK